MEYPAQEISVGASTVDTTPQPLTISRVLYKGVTVAIDPEALGSLFVGSGPNDCLYMLVPDLPGMQTVFVPVDNLGKVWVRGSASDIGYQWIGA